MEFPAASAHRGLVPWLGLLLAVFPSCLAIWIPPTTAQISLVSTSAAEGEDVILRIRKIPPGVLGFMWYRGMEATYSNFIGFIALGSGQHTKGPRYSGRETPTFDGSLIIRKVTRSDQGMYMAVALLPNNKRPLGFGTLIVYGPVSEPILIASSTTVTENEDAVEMDCYSDAWSTNWLFNATSLQLSWRVRLSHNRRTLTINPVRREDAGNYQCQVSNPISSAESEPVVLEVKY